MVEELGNQFHCAAIVTWLESPISLCSHYLKIQSRDKKTARGGDKLTCLIIYLKKEIEKAFISAKVIGARVTKRFFWIFPSILEILWPRSVRGNEKQFRHHELMEEL